MSLIGKCLAIVDGAVSWALLLATFALFFGGIALLGFQCYIWARTGVWLPISVVDGSTMAGASWQWLSAPQDLIGIHQILSALPASLTLSVSALLPGAAYAAWMESSPFGS